MRCVHSLGDLLSVLVTLDALISDNEKLAVCWNHYLRMMDLVRNYAVEGRNDMDFSLGNACKDVGYYVAMGEHLGAQPRIGPATLALLEETVAADMGECMVPEAVDYLKERGTE